SEVVREPCTRTAARSALGQAQRVGDVRHVGGKLLVRAHRTPQRDDDEDGWCGLTSRAMVYGRTRLIYALDRHPARTSQVAPLDRPAPGPGPGKRNRSIGPTKPAHAASLCGAPSTSRYARSMPNAHPFATNAPRTRRAASTTPSPSAVPVLSQILHDGLACNPRIRRTMNRLSHHTDGDNTARLPNTLG